jgi:hypothetical protein
MLVKRIRTVVPIVSKAKRDLATMTASKTEQDQHLEPSAGVVVGAGGIKVPVDVDVIVQSRSRMMVTTMIRDASRIGVAVIMVMKTHLVPRKRTRKRTSTRTKTRMRNTPIETVQHRRPSPNGPATATAGIETRTSGETGTRIRTKTNIVVMIAKSPVTAPRIGIEITTASDAGTRIEIAATKTVRTARIDIGTGIGIGIGIGTDMIATETVIERRAKIVTETAIQDIAADINQLMLELHPMIGTPSLPLVLAVMTRNLTLRAELKAQARTLTHSSVKPVIASVCLKKRNVSLV